MRAWHLGYSLLTRDARVASLLLLLIAVLCGLFAVRALRRPGAPVVAVGLNVAMLAVVLSLVPRARLWVAIGYNGWPVANATLARLLVDDAARLGIAVRLIESAGGEALVRGDAMGLVVAVPVTWPWPDGAEYALEDTGDRGVLIRTRFPAVAFECARRVADSAFTPDMVEGAVSCARPRASRALRWRVPARVSEPAVNDLPAATDRAGWHQYRADPRRSAMTARDDTLAVRWSVKLSGPVRASASATTEVVMIGMHGTGTIEARRLRDGGLVWRVHAPNWIHQDVVIDGDMAFAGFGDNLGSRTGEAPSGVVALDVATGATRWTRFASGSVMTSPVLLDSLVIAGTSHGELIAWSRRDGRELWRRRLPGQVTMAPPLLADGVVFVALDVARVCAVAAVDGVLRWCRTITGAAMLGHSSPSLIDNRLFITSTRPVPLTDLLRRLRGRALAALLSTQFQFEESRLHEQEVLALDPASGDLLWRQPIGEGTAPAGHSSGTAVPLGSDHLAVVAPVPGGVVSLRLTDGEKVGWHPLEMPTRGPALPMDSAVLVMNGRGELVTLRGAGLSPSCVEPWDRPMDRAGPIRVGGTLIAASRDGWLLARPLQQHCLRD